MALDACDFNVILDIDNHDHDMNYLHNEHHEAHHHNHSHEHHHHHEHRGLKEIVEIINKSQITDRAKEIAIRILILLLIAEAKAHGASIDEVHSMK